MSPDGTGFRNLRHATLALWGTGLLAGLVLALGVLSGDAQGRVNLLYLLLLFAFLPVAGLILSLVLLASGSGSALSRLVLGLPLWPAAWRRDIMALGRHNAQKPWFLYQSQVLALGFGLGGLLAFFILLIGSDVSFIWRSTLLEAGDLLPWLKALALPWAWWDEARPSLELLRQTRDYRLESEASLAVAVLGQWWKYVFAAQCVYNLLPRGIMLLVFRHYYLRHLQESGSSAPGSGNGHAPVNRVPEEGDLAPVEHSLDRDYLLVNWAGAPSACLDCVGQALRPPLEVLRAGPLASGEEEQASLREDQSRVVLVKSWEPPLGELRDYLEAAAGGGWLLPLDWDEGERPRPTGEGHLNEWRRFCGSLPGWGLLQPGFGAASVGVGPGAAGPGAASAGQADEGGQGA